MVLFMKLVGHVFFASLFLCAKSINQINFNKSQKLLLQIDTSENFATFINSLGEKFLKESDVMYLLIPTAADAEILAAFEKMVMKVVKLWAVFTNDSCNCWGSADKKLGMRLPYEKKVKTYIFPTVYIIPLQKYSIFEHLECLMQRLQILKDFNPRALFLIIIPVDEYLEPTQYVKISKEIFEYMWRINLLRTNLIWLDTRKHSVTPSCAKPFTSENQCRQLSENLILYYNISDEKKSRHCLFYDEFTNFKTCEIVIETIPLPPYVVGKPHVIGNELYYDFTTGIEIELVRLTSKIMNFTYKFKKTNSYGLDAWFSLLPNGTVIGILQDLIDHKIDMAFGGFLPDYVTYPKFDYSTSYRYASLAYYVTDPNFIPQWLIFFVAFPLEVWTLSGFVFVFVSLIYYFMDKFRVINNKQKIRVNFTAFFSINLGMSSTLDPRLPHLRFILFAWAVYSVHWCSAYTSILFTYFANPPLERKLKTISDLKESGLKVCLDSLYESIFSHDKVGEFGRSVLDNYIVCTHLPTCVQEFITYRNFSIMEKTGTIEYLINLKRARVHKLCPNLITYFVSTITSRGNPVSLQFNQIAMRAVEAGILLKWEVDVRLQYQDAHTVDISQGSDPISFNLKDLTGAFLILIFGLSVSMVVFSLEIMKGLSRREKVELL